MFECPYCGWSLEGGDETGVWVMRPDGKIEYDERFNYCFHCGEKIGDYTDDEIRKRLAFLLWGVIGKGA